MPNAVPDGGEQITVGSPQVLEVSGAKSTATDTWPGGSEVMTLAGHTISNTQGAHDTSVWHSLATFTAEPSAVCPQILCDTSASPVTVMALVNPPSGISTQVLETEHCTTLVALAASENGAGRQSARIPMPRTTTFASGTSPAATAMR